MPFAFIGFFLGARAVSLEQLSWEALIYVVLCMVFARNAAMAFNRWADRTIDAGNERTASREIPAGKISSKSAFLFVVVNSLLFIGTTYFINKLCFYLSPVALITVLGYSLTKRFTSLCHFVLGLGLSLAPIGAYIAVTGQFAVLPLLFSAIVLFWTGGFDIIYALQDEDFDRGESLHSVPSKLGAKRALWLSIIVHFATALFVLSAGWFGDFHFIYWAGAMLFLALLVYQHTIVKPDDLTRVNLAFGTTNGIASVIYGATVVVSILVA